MPVIKNDEVLGKIAGKLQQIIEQILWFILNYYIFKHFLWVLDFNINQ